MAITPNHGIYYPTRDMHVREVRSHITTLASSTDDALQALVDGYAVVENQAVLPTSGNYPGRRAWVTSLGYEFVWTGSQWEVPDPFDTSVFPHIQGQLTRSVSYIIGNAEAIVAFNSWVGAPAGVTLVSNGMRVSQAGLYAVDVSLGIFTTSGTNAGRLVVNGDDRRLRYLTEHGGTSYRSAWTEHLRLNANDLVQVSASAASPNAQLSTASDFTVTRISP